MSICEYCKHQSPAAGMLDHDESEQLEHSCVKALFAKGDIIFKQQALSSNVIYVREGIVKIHLLGPAREQILKIAKGPTYLGIPTTLGDKVNQYSATALTTVSACFIDINTFKSFINSNGAFAYEIIVDLCRDELIHYKRCINQMQKQSPGRVAEALLAFSKDIFNSDSFTLPLTQSELGDLSGCSRENVSRILSNFSHEKLITTSGRGITIVNKHMLEQVSKLG